MYMRFNDGKKLLTGADGRCTETGLVREKAHPFPRNISICHRTVHAIVETPIHRLQCDPENLVMWSHVQK